MSHNSPMAVELIERFNQSIGDRYRIERELGHGGMATVYLADDRRHHRRVAVKVLNAAMSQTLGPERFLREIEVTARLTHPHILPLHDSGTFEDLLFYVMPYIEGKSVRARLRNMGRLPLAEALRITGEVADALEYAHGQGVVHRDIKPENILLQGEHALVADFGIARLTAKSESPEDHAHSTTIVLGTPVYMSPEQVVGSVHLDGRSDIYSLACVLYEMLAGSPPYYAEDAASTVAKRFSGEPPKVRQTCPQVPQAVETAIVKALSLDAQLRFGTIADFAASLTATASEARQTTNSIVVLPFVNLSSDPENEYFADGLTDEIIADLCGVRSLQVISRTSAMRLKRTDKTLRAIARELDVHYVLEGSIRHTGDRLRVTAQLVDAETDAHIWADKFSGASGDVFAIQEEISRKIVGALRLQLTEAEDRHVASRPLDNLPAYQCYLRARQDIYTWSEESLERATHQVDAAAQIVGENALLLATQGLIYWMYVNGSVRPDERYLGRAEDCAKLALQLDPNSYLAIFVRGLVAAKRGDVEHGLLDLTKARELAPGDANVLTEICRYLATAGFETEAREAADTLLKIDPLTPIGWHCAAAIDWLAGRFRRALPAVRRIFDLAGPKSPLRIPAAWTLAAAGQRPRAIELLKEYASELPDTHYAGLATVFAQALAGNADAVVDGITPELEQAASWQEHRARILADSYALIGRTHEAMIWLEVAVRRGLIHYPFIATHDPFLASVRGDARFEWLTTDVKRRWDAFQA